MKPLGWRISAMLLGNAWLALLLLLLTPVYVRLLGVESYGLIGFYATWVAILGIMDMGISATANRQLAWLSARPDEAGKISDLVKSLEGIYWGAMLLLGMALLALAWVYGQDWFRLNSMNSDHLRQALMLMVVSLMVQVPSGLYVAGLAGLQRQAEGAGLLALFGTLRSVGAAACLWLVLADIRLFFLWQLVAGIVQVLVFRKALWRRLPVPGHASRFSRDAIASIRQFAGGMTLITALSLVLCQADKIILSRLVALEQFGYYALAWTVASGLMVVAMPLMQAYGPRYTSLISAGNREELVVQVRRAAQLMNVAILPPAAFLVVLAQPILLAWLGNPDAADGAASALRILAVGTALVACSYPALNILYSGNRLRPVIVIHLVCVAIMLPVLVLLILEQGIVGAAFSWALYGLILFVTYQVCGLGELRQGSLLRSLLGNFLAIGLVSFILAQAASAWMGDPARPIWFFTQLIFWLFLAWGLCIFLSRELRNPLVAMAGSGTICR